MREPFVKGPQVSPHEVKVYQVVLNSSEWLTTKEIADLAGVAKRTANHHASRLVQRGVFQRYLLSGGYRYSALDAIHRNREYEQVLIDSAIILGLD